MRLKDQVVLVTGSARGIGKEIALTFAKEGALAIISDVNAEMAQATAEEFKKMGLKADFEACNVTNMQSVEEMTNKILDKHKSVDILVNNAGITRDNLLLRMSEADWDAVIAVNLKGTFNCTKVVSKAMLKAKKGKIISIASIIGITGNAGQVNYAASKAGVIALTKSIAKELASRSITVNAVAPGFISTEMTATIPPEVREKMISKIPLGRAGEPRDVAELIRFLASDEASYIQGEVIGINGGFQM